MLGCWPFGKGVWRNGGKGEGVKKYKLVIQNSQGDVKSKCRKHLCITHGHEKGGGTGWSGAKGENWNCNNIINKKLKSCLYFKKKIFQ